MQQLSQVQEKLDKLSKDKLIEIVKNYRQFGYEEAVRTYALALLEQRGISAEDLRLTGNLENHTYKSAERLYVAFLRNSKIAFVCYLVVIVWILSSRMAGIESESSRTVVSIGLLVLFIVYLLFLLQSFLSQSQFYKAVGVEYSNGAIIYLLIGMPFYIIMYFIFAKEMKEKMQAI